MIIYSVEIEDGSLRRIKRRGNPKFGHQSAKSPYIVISRKKKPQYLEDKVVINCKAADREATEDIPLSCIVEEVSPMLSAVAEALIWWARQQPGDCIARATRGIRATLSATR